MSRTPATAPTGPSPDPERLVDLRRLRTPVIGLAVALSLVSAVGGALGTVVAGRLAADPGRVLVGVLALCLVGAALLDTVGRTIWATVVDRAEGRLRADLLAAALSQPLAVLDEQAVGEVLDRVDDDTHEIGSLFRRQVWDVLRVVFGVLPLWVVGGLTWWPAWLLFPVAAAGVVGLVRPLLGEIARRKVVEEMAWTDHAAAMEEGVAGRDDIRTSGAQAHVVRRVSELAALVHRRFLDVLSVELTVSLRAGLALHGLLAAVVVGGVALAVDGQMGTARLVTLFLVTSGFVGQVDQVARQLPDLQAGLGAVLRLRQLMASPPEPTGGRSVDSGQLSLRFHHLDFAYDEGTFALRDIQLDVPAGQTLALVGRTGSGKSTLASLVSRAVDPHPGTVLLGGTDVLRLELQQLRATVGVVTQRTDVLAGTLAENIALFGDLPRERLSAAVDELGLTAWVAGLPDGLDTLLGPGGTTLSAGEEQLIAFARLLVREVQVVILDEATARMDPLTEARVVRAADRLLAGRTGVLVAHRLSTTARADQVAVLDRGRVVQSGLRSDLAASPGPFRDLLEASEEVAPDMGDAGGSMPTTGAEPGAVGAVGGVRRRGSMPERAPVSDGPSLARGITRALAIHPRWGLLAVGFFMLTSLTGALGTLTGFAWGRLVQDVDSGGRPVGLTTIVVISVLAAPVLIREAMIRYPRWWVAVMLRARTSVLVGQVRPHRLPRTPPGEVVARAMDADRFARYADRWVDVAIGGIIVVVTALLGGSLVAGAVLLAVMTVSAVASVLGRPVAGRSAAAASTARARFGRSLVSALESARTVKLAAATPDVHRHLRRVDRGRVEAAVREHRVQALLDGVPVVMVQTGVVVAWLILVLGGWDLATALLVSGAVAGFDHFGRVAGAVITEAPGTAAWQRETCRLAGGEDLMTLPAGVDLVSGTAPRPATVDRTTLRRLELRDLSAVHDDGTLGVRGVDLVVQPGELVLLLGQVGSGKSSLLASLAGLVDHTGSLRWNDEEVDDAEAFLRPAQVAHVAQQPRVLSGTLSDNVRLDHDRQIDDAIDDARLGTDVEEAGGVDAVVGHRGVRLSGGQVQRLALARALAARTELVLADDVSSALDAATEVELWRALRSRGSTVVGASSKRAALGQADRVVVLVDGEVAETGPWHELSHRWSHLAG